MSKLIISEPWDFEDIQGGNELSGRILKRLDSKTLLFRTEEEVTLKGLSRRDSGEEEFERERDQLKAIIGDMRVKPGFMAKNSSACGRGTRRAG